MRRQSGFTLLEVLAAFLVAALALGAVLQSYSAGMRGQGTADAYSRAALHAASLLARVGRDQPVVEGERSGEIDGRYRWTMVTEPAVLEGFPEAQTAALSLMRVTLTVSWGEGAAADELGFVTLRAAAAPQ